MDTNLQRLALGIAGNVWKAVQRAHQATWDVDDLRQEALVAAWQWSREHPDWNATPHARSTCAQAIRYDLVDYMRRSGSGKRRADGSYPHRTPRSLDEPVHVAHNVAAGRVETLADTLEDTAAQDALELVEVAADVHRAFAEHPGNPRHAAAAWLALHGVTLQDIGDHYGVTESRACQYRTAFIDATARRWADAGRHAERSAA